MDFRHFAVSLRNFLLFLLLSACFPLSGQEVLSMHFTNQSGLPSSEVYDLLRDSKGFIWIATDRGVSRFDGYRFIPFNTDNGLTDNTVFNLFEGCDGKIWCCPVNGKICYIQNDSVYTYRWVEEVNRHLPANHVVRTLCEKKDGTLQLGTLGGMIEVSASGSIRDIRDEKNPDAHALALLQDNHLLYARLIHQPNGGSDKVKLSVRTPVFADTIQFPTQYLRNDIEGLLRHNGDIVIALNNACVEISRSGSSRVIQFSRSVLRVCEDLDSCLWVSLSSGGVIRFRPNHLEQENAGEKYFAGESISCVLEDPEHGFWFSSLQNGVHYAPDLNTRIQLDSSDDPLHNDVAAITGNGSDTLYAGMRDGRLFCSDGNSWKQISLSGQNTIKRLSYDKKQHAVIISRIGVISVDSRFHEKSVADTRAYDMIAEGDSVFVAGFYAVEVYRGGKLLRTFRSSNGNFRVETLMKDSHGNLWAGGTEGLYRLVDSVFVRQTQHPGFSSRISDMMEDKSRRLLIATIGKGLLVCEGKKIKQVSSRNGLSSSIINAMTVDEQGKIWLGTIDGLSCVELKNDTFSVRNYNTRLTSDIRDIFVQRGVVWIATAAGLVSFVPSPGRINTFQPPVYITGVSADRGAIPDQAQLRYTENTLRISFTGLSYRSMGAVRYRYRLLGADTVWKTITTNNVLYASLLPGDYVFEVYAVNEDGIASVAPARFAFSIFPPYWRTWWFLFLLLTAGLGLFWLLISYRLRQVRMQNMLRINVLEYRQQALAGQMNPHFIFNALNSIQSYLVTEERLKAMKYLSRFARLMRISLDHSRENFVLLSNELELIRLYLELETMRHEEKINWNVDVEAGIADQKMMIPSMIIQPFLENAVRHGLLHKTNGEGRLTVSFFMKKDQLHCVVDDNGAGREATMKKERFGHRSAGTSITVERLRLLCSSQRQEFYYEVTDKKDEQGNPAGTTVHFILPFIHQQEHESIDR